MQKTTARVKGSYFVRNFAHDFGAAIHTQLESTYMKIERCQFKQNTAFGAILDADGKMSLLISNCTFVSNTAYGSLGVISTIDAVTLQMSDSYYIANNYVTTNGIVYLAGSVVYFSGNMEFFGNSGPVYIYNSRVNFTGSTIFDHFIASKGGAISVFQVTSYFVEKAT